MAFSFKTWENRRRHLLPDTERLLPLVQNAGAVGMTRQQIGNAVDLDRDVLDQLLAGMAGMGLLTVSTDSQGPVYRATTAMV